MLFVCLLSASHLMRLDLRVTHCPTPLYPKDPEMPGTTKVRKRTLEFPVRWFAHTSVQIFFKINKKLHASSYIQSQLRHMDYVNISHNLNREWESIDLETELKLSVLIDLITYV